MRRAFTLIELLVVLAIMAILSAAMIPVVKRVWRGGNPVVREEPVDAPVRRPVPNSYRFHVDDGVLAAEISQVLSNSGFNVQWLDKRTATVRHK